MLTELRVRNLALIETAELELGPGLTVLTGETGAGKTALLSSLKLLIGERGDSAMVGSFADEARVEAAFEMSAEEEALNNSLDRQENGADACEHLIVRRLSSEGRSRCYLDDSLVTVGRLNEVFGPSVDLYGQHEHQSLLKPREQLRILDEFGGEKVKTAFEAYLHALHEFQEASKELERLRELGASSGAEQEQAAFVLREIGKIAPQVGEYEALEAELPRLQNGEQLIQVSHQALELLRGESGALEKLASAVQTLNELGGIDPALDETLEQTNSLLVGLEEAVVDISRYAAGIEHDPEALQRALDRLGELDGLSRRFGPGMDQVFELAHHSELLLQTAGDASEHIQEAENKLSAAKAALEDAAKLLSAARISASEQFSKQLNKSIADLALSGASLEFSIQDLPFEKWGSAGPQSFDLLYKPAPSAPAAPLAKIASGGELSRVMLGIKSLLQHESKAMTLVFDEIDAGIGGKTANAVADRLAALAKGHQVIVITHLAQIAARADHHFLVSKEETKQGVKTTIARLQDTKREEEIARMLSGTLDAEALAHARKLLEEVHT